MISEGTRYQVRNLIIEGNTKIKTEVLREGLELHSRQAVPGRCARRRQEAGCLPSTTRSAASTPTWASSPSLPSSIGVVDLVYKIEEHEPYMLGELRSQGNARTKDKVIRREAVQAGLLPGEVLDKNRIDMYQAAAGLAPATSWTTRIRASRSRSRS